ncbi:hypothetical protein D9M68_209940 [compost metagenome]
MLDRCIEYFMNEPRRLMNVGRAILNCSGFLVVAGLCGALATTATSVVVGMASKARPAVDLADVFPNLPVWWVPETVVGYGFALCCGLIGVWLIQAGRTLQRMHR